MGQRIAIVDDDPVIVMVAEELLRQEGHEVRAASTGLGAVELVRSWTPHLLLLDYYLSGATAPEVVAEIRRFDALVQVILVTGFADKQPARKLMSELDIQGYHDKGDAPARLLVQVDAALKHRAALDRAERQRGYLRHILDVAPELLRLQPVPELLNAALAHVGPLLQVGDRSPDSGDSGLFLLERERGDAAIRAATGAFAGAAALSDLPPAVAAAARDGLRAIRPSAHASGHVTIPLRTRDGECGCIVVQAPRLPLEAVEPCEIYAHHVVLALENVLLYERATVDPLTQVYARDFGLRRLRETLRLGTRTDDVTSVILLDIDRFKAINDGFGHAAGDQALRSIAGVLHAACRTTDVIARHGGEEFLIVLPATGGEGARIVAERVRAAIAGAAVEFEGRSLRLTASLGVASARVGDHDEEAVLRDADAAMYLAKSSGRNAVVCSDATKDAPSHPSRSRPGGS